MEDFYVADFKLGVSFADTKWYGNCYKMTITKHQ